MARICPFYLGKYSVRQAQWEAVMGNNPSKFKGNPNRPVEYISWYDGQAFMHELNEREGSNCLVCQEGLVFLHTF